MAPMSRDNTCVIGINHDDDLSGWTGVFTECIMDVGLEAVDYSLAAVDNANYLLAFPHDDDSVIYQMAYAMGRGLKVLALVEENENFDHFQPKPKRIPINFNHVNAKDDAKNCIKKALKKVIASNDTGIAMCHPEPSTEKNVPLDPKGMYPLSRT